MPVDEPRWWYDAPEAAPARLLQPLGWLAGRIAGHRWRSARPHLSGLTVVCVGNFTAGGTGKTPLALEIARLLRQLGETPVFLSRGYGGTERGPHRVDAANDAASAVGDEPLLLARTASVVVCRDRAAGARSIEAEIAAGRLAATVIVMDDGLQNPQLAKDLTLAVVDGRRGFGNGRVIPAGPLRAPLALQFARTDAVIVNEPPGLPQPGAAANDLRQRFAGPVLAATVTIAPPAPRLAERPIVAFAGIGNPQRFFELIRGHGGTVVAELAFADHQPLGDADAARILETARRQSAMIVTTEKDMARLAGASGASAAQLRATAVALPIKLALPAADEKRLIHLLRAAIASKRRS